MLAISKKGDTCWAQFRGTPPGLDDGLDQGHPQAALFELSGESSDLACDDHVRKVFLGV